MAGIAGNGISIVILPVRSAVFLGENSGVAFGTLHRSGKVVVINGMSTVGQVTPDPGHIVGVSFCDVFSVKVAAYAISKFA